MVACCDTRPSTATSLCLLLLQRLPLQKILVRGANLGPALTGAAANSPALQPRLTYTDASGIFSYSTLCSKSADSPHSLMECQTVAGVGTGLQFAANVCGLSSSLVPLSSASYAKPVLREVTGPGASRASTEGGQIVVLSVREVGPRSLIDAIPFPITDVRYGTPGQLQFIPTGCWVSFASTSGSEITCLTAAGFGFNHAWQLSVGFQTTYLAANTSYGPPVSSRNCINKLRSSPARIFSTTAVLFATRLPCRPFTSLVASQRTPRRTLAPVSRSTFTVRV